MPLAGPGLVSPRSSRDIPHGWWLVVSGASSMRFFLVQSPAQQQQQQQTTHLTSIEIKP
jgi:hypothetical protein